MLVREARRLGYSLRMVKLAVATYRLGRVIRIRGVCSRIVFANRGIVAGSGTATTELRVVLIVIVDAALVVHPVVTPSLYVDDLSSEVSGGPDTVARELVGFTIHVCDRFHKDGFEVSMSKSVFTASSVPVAADIESRFGVSPFPLRYAARVTSLGAGLGAGTRRNVQIQTQRLAEFQARAPRFWALKGAGVSVPLLLRGGGIAALTYGQAVTRVSCSMLDTQRRSVGRSLTIDATLAVD